MIEKLLKFEEDSRILDYKLASKDVIIWPLIRYSFYLRFISDFTDQNINESTNKKIRKNFTKYLNFIKSIFTFNRKLEGRSDILFLYDSISNIKLDDGKYFNRLFDYYSALFEEKTVMIESGYTNGHQKPRWYNKVHFYQGHINIRRIKSRLSKSSFDDNIKIEEFINFILSNFPVQINDKDIKFLRKSLRILSVNLKYIEKDYIDIFKKFNPKIIFIEDALYGSFNAYIIKLAKERGIITAEFQHGMISKKHIAYNYSDLLCNSELYSLYTPSYLLTMGEYWNNNCKVPSKKVIMGMPHLFTNIEKYKNRNISEIDKKNKKKKIILFICGNYHNEYINYLKKLCENKNPNITYVVKVHPAYINNKSYENELGDYNNIKIVYFGDIHELIRDADLIVGDISTAVYESIAYDKKIIILENEDSLLYTPKEIGIWVKNYEQLKRIIDGDDYINNDRLEIWNSNWEKNYVDFINKIL